MQQKIQLKYINNVLNIGLVNWREAYLLSPTIISLMVEVDNGRLVYRAKGSSRRFTYCQVRKELIKTTKVITEEVPDWFLIHKMNRPLINPLKTIKP